MINYGKLRDEKMNKLDLQKAINKTPHTIAKMGRDENVNMEILCRIGKYFKCDISEVLEYKMEEKGCKEMILVLE